MNKNNQLSIDKIPLKHNSVKISGYDYRGTHYCVISHFKDENLIEDKIGNLISSEFDSLNLHKKSDDKSSTIDIDNGSSL